MIWDFLLCYDDMAYVLSLLGCTTCSNIYLSTQPENESPEARVDCEDLIQAEVQVVVLISLDKHLLHKQHTRETVLSSLQVWEWLFRWDTSSEYNPWVNKSTQRYLTNSLAVSLQSSCSIVQLSQHMSL